MKYKISSITILLILVTNCIYSVNTETKFYENSIKQSSKAVLSRVLGKKASYIEIKVIKPEDKNDVYEYECSNGILNVEGSSVSAICRGVYDFLKSQHIGMLDWNGGEWRFPERLPNAPKTRVVTPFQIRHAYNAVTSGYTSPYWDWERWEKELDWQAMHGFNMLMAPVASEAIIVRVYKQLGLTQEEIDEHYTGPAHLPWSRMGCIANVGGSLPDDWHEDQIALQHKLLERMKELGINPVIQSFNGFIPKGFKRLYPNTTFHETLWNAGFPKSQRPWLIMPNDDLFAKITKMYMQEWQNEFGETKYYLVDSFNEMDLPKTDEPVTEMLANYGEKTFNVIKAGDENAVWVIQGWMFAYQRHIWNPETVKALFSKVPDDRVLILDYANDYNNNWEPMNAFNGKQWVYGFVPNMGGKTAYTGDLNLYASGTARALHSDKKENLIGFTISGEGLENNNVVYELLTDVAWSKDSINLDKWLKEYCINRYGACPANMIKAWELLRQSCYDNLIPHPQLGWQLGRCGHGSVNRDPEFFEAVKLFLDCKSELSESKNYEADVIEISAIALGLKADEWFKVAKDAYLVDDIKTGERAGERGLEILLELDHLMESHPLNRLDIWIDFAKSHSNDKNLQLFYESNARQLITTWGPPVNDYSCRIWSGLVRDFYHERMVAILSSVKANKKFDRKSWEQNWVDGSGISTVKPFKNPIQTATILIDKSFNEKLPIIKTSNANIVGEWTPANTKENWSVIEFPISTKQLRNLKGIRFIYTKGNHRLDIKEVSVVADGKVVAKDEHVGYAGKPNNLNRYLFKIPSNAKGNNGCSIRALVKVKDGKSSFGQVQLLLK
ncbi:MAG: alpha-N-acetylglucosaminidase [Marinilabiliaceae bacterium]|nr:alpha-N-acetylglucosaminidase [Marinilabiliaceae bacterium]